ncbi:hypothetical protein F2P56_022649 [Juglans regia]|uniref:Uncharacterized protein n=1 Tax=Juglans regia TaxID=51240 RepID=A0A833X3Y3_JUGRE|nr:hypothetical protein F2P56_022649 [Juglans regia]
MPVPRDKENKKQIPLLLLHPSTASRASDFSSPFTVGSRAHKENFSSLPSHEEPFGFPSPSHTISLGSSSRFFHFVSLRFSTENLQRVNLNSSVIPALRFRTSLHFLLLCTSVAAKETQTGVYFQDSRNLLVKSRGMNDGTVELGTTEEGRADAQYFLSVRFNDDGYILCFMMGPMLRRFVG